MRAYDLTVCYYNAECRIMLLLATAAACDIYFLLSDDDSRNHSDTFCRRLGQVEPPRFKETDNNEDIPEKVALSTSLPLPHSKGLEVYDNRGVMETWDQEEEEGEERMPNKTIEELRRNSTSSLKKPSSPFPSPFRRISSPLTKSGRFSISSLTSKFGRKSMEIEAEAVNLMVVSPVTSPTESPSTSGE